MVTPMSLTLSEPLFWLYLLNLCLVLATVLHMLYQRRSPQNLMTWLLTLILLPYIGVVLYIIFGSRKFLYKRGKPNIELPSSTEITPPHFATEMDNLLRRNHIPGTTQHNTIQLCPSNEEAFNEFMQLIDQAQHCIHLETYIFELDATGEAILQALIKKAQQGVQVRLLLDAIGSFSLHLNPSPLKPLRHAGGEFAFFQPVLHAFFKSKLNLRNHRKIYLFDHHTLLTGGMNLSNDYLGTADTAPIGGRWMDLLFKIEGPAVCHYQTVFNEDWFYTTSEQLPTILHPAPPEQPILSGELIQTIPAGPDMAGDALFEGLLHSLYMAKSSIQIITPYFVPDSSVMNALMIAAKRGVEVTLITPQSSDHLIFDLGRSSYMRELFEAGAQLHYYQTTMLHAKLILIDHQYMLVGSANFDYRSLFINYEIVNVLYSTELIETLDHWMQSLLRECLPYRPNNSKLSRLLENLTRIVAPIL
jgi:cardiolipin synthase